LISVKMPAVLAAAILLALGSGPAAAVCPGLDILFQDQFQTLQPTWGGANPAIRIDNGQLVLTPPSGTYVWAINNAGVYDDVDMCVSVTAIGTVDATEAKAGPIFWYQDVNNFYVFEIAPNGKASLWRRQRGKWLAQVNWQDASSANKGEGAVNELRVTTLGGDATLYVNGTEFRKVAGSPPDNGQQIGLFAGSPDDAAASFGFDDLKATKP
jgi:hypothetical protein